MTATDPQLPVVDLDALGPQVGDAFPDVRLPDQHGEIIDLHTHRNGRPALFVVHRSAAW